MLRTPFFDPNKSYYENYEKGPFGEFVNKRKYKEKGKPDHYLFGIPIYTPFGIPAGPLLNSKFVNAALDKGFDITSYKTVRTRPHTCNEWPNVLAVKVRGNLTLKQADKGLIGINKYTPPIAITNSFGVPSYDPDIWQKDMAKAVKHAKPGQIVVGSFQGTTNSKGDVKNYIKDFVLAARLVKETGAKALEVNLSCPNEGSAHLLCFDLPRTREIVEVIKNEIGNTPLIIKIAYFDDPKRLEKLVLLVGKTVEGISAINTIPARIYNEKGEQALPGENRLRSGVCGHPIKWAGLEMVRRLKSIREELGLRFAIIGVGGVTDPNDYFEYRLGGADAVMSATGAMWNPLLAQEIKNNL
ncbi:MAG: dihydroorotate oxidase [Candidatus Levybacteria bacterium]|nr:dihydroorotate oxidase [Candidatus Levybacteria bacterium]